MKDRTEIHDRENNQESEQFLKENSKRFSRQCLIILQLFYNGVRLTCKSALINHGIGHLPRRLADLKENGVQIAERWLTDENGKRTVKEWFFNFKTDGKKDVAAKWKDKVEKNGTNYEQGKLL